MVEFSQTPDDAKRINPLAIHLIYKYALHTCLSSLKWRGDGQTDSMPGVCNNGFDPLSHLGNIVMRIGKKNVQVE